MRNEFAKVMIETKRRRPEFVFLTGDLGFMAFEKLQGAYGPHFINAGVAEQNMISAAAGMAYEGLLPWVYNIAPFAVLRPYEQIRNDVCFHNLPVKIVGNGGGYGYGIMGSTHHTLEDIAACRLLPNMKVFLPVTLSDVGEAMKMMADDPGPNYLRLNSPAKLNFSPPEFQAWRKLKTGGKVVVIGAGPVLGNLFQMKNMNLLNDLEVWSVGVLPAGDIPSELRRSLSDKKKIVVMEEHYSACGLNELVARGLVDLGLSGLAFRSLYAAGCPGGRVGSQRWLQEQSGLAGEKMEKILGEIIDA